jgi:hypothetical protein
MMKCDIGGCFRQPVEKAHIKSKGSGGSNKKHNIIHLCSFHHRTGPNAFHNIGVWSFAKLFDLVERFEEAYDVESEIVTEKKDKQFKKYVARQKKKAKRICPTCKRVWSKGVIKESEK